MYIQGRVAYTPSDANGPVAPANPGRWCVWGTAAACMPPGTIELSGCAPRAGGHRFEAPGVSLPLGTVARLGEDQDRGVAGGEPGAVEAASEALSGLPFHGSKLHLSIKCATQTTHRGRAPLGGADRVATWLHVHPHEIEDMRRRGQVDRGFFAHFHLTQTALGHTPAPKLFGLKSWRAVTMPGVRRAL